MVLHVSSYLYGFVIRHHHTLLEWLAAFLFFYLFVVHESHPTCLQPWRNAPEYLEQL